MKPHLFRRKFLIYPEVQNSVIRIFILAGGAGFLGLVIGAIIFGQKIFRLVESTGAAASPENQMTISQIWFNFTFFLVTFGILYVVGLAALGLFFSHRLVGPILRISSDLCVMIENNRFNLLKIRDTDFLEKIVSQLNNSIQIRGTDDTDANAKDV
ncbi:MAG: hypothetical protein H7326_10130 [Bdellovibrionaceae bacterium]|nr:hypothetical protein [Pseudobdellovibrionaceae bacterium]